MLGKSKAEFDPRGRRRRGASLQRKGPETMVEPKTAESRAAIQRNAELILNRLSDYLSIRFDLAGRINAPLKGIKQDLMVHELANVRRSLLSDKIYGPIKMSVTDVFMGDDDKKRRGLMSASDQTSIQVELVSHCQDSKVEATRGQIKIHDLKTFYAAINPDLAELMDLVETWIWWDILDAAEIVRFEQKIQQIQAVRQGRLGEEGRKKYLVLIHPPVPGEEETARPHTVSDDEVIRYEFKQLIAIREQWQYRRGNERGYQYVLKRDEAPAKPMGELVHRIGEYARQYETIEGLDALDDETKQKYADTLHLSADKVTQKVILDQLQALMVQAEREMLGQIDRDVQLGPPYNYKERQAEQMDRVMSDLANQLRAVLQPAAAPGHGAPAAAGAAPQAAPAGA